MTGNINEPWHVSTADKYCPRDPLPATISSDNAKLPAAYEQAKRALAKCERLDECKDWADKAAALASYARQARDDTLVKQAQRIRSRAQRRVGELTRELNAQGERTDILIEGTPKKLTQFEVGAAAGLSPHQVTQAIRIANIPKDEFERLVESDNPPTLTELAEIGRKRRQPAPTPEPEQIALADAIETTSYDSRRKEEAETRYKSFLIVADDVAQSAFYNGRIDEAIIKVARRAANAWSNLAERLESEYGKGHKEKSTRHPRYFSDNRRS